MNPNRVTVSSDRYMVTGLQSERKLTMRHLALVENDRGEVSIYTAIPGGVLGDKWLEVLGEPGVNRWDRGIMILEALLHTNEVAVLRREVGILTKRLEQPR